MCQTWFLLAVNAECNSLQFRLSFCCKNGSVSCIMSLFVSTLSLYIWSSSVRRIHKNYCLNMVSNCTRSSFPSVLQWPFSLFVSNLLYIFDPHQLEECTRNIFTTISFIQWLGLSGVEVVYKERIESFTLWSNWTFKTDKS